MDRDSESSSRRWTNFTNALLALKGTTITERKRGVDRLISILDDDDESLSEIDLNSMCAQNNNVITWNSLFMEVEAFFHKETEKIQGPSLDQRKIAAFNLIHRVFSRANSKRTLLSTKKVYDFIITKLENKLYVGCFGYSLIQMLQSFFAIKLYTSTLSTECWSHIIAVLIRLYNRSADHTISKALLLDSLNRAILHGSNHPNVIQVLRTQVIDFYKGFEATQRHNVPTTLLLKGVVLLCEKNAVEFRGMLCKFGERFLPNILANTSSSTIEDEEAATINLFLVQLKLHNPCDISSTSPAFYADDTSEWLYTVTALYSYCIETIEDIARKVTFSKDRTISQKLLELSAKCTKQISYDVMRTEELGLAEEVPPTKKHMACRTFQSIVSDTAQQPPSNSQIVWLQYITAVLSAFPDLAETLSSVQSLFELGLGLLNSTFVVREEIYLFFLCLLYCEKYLLKSKVLKQRSNSWSHVYDITIKSLSVNQAKPQALELLRVLLIEIEPPNINSLLHLYVNRSLVLTEASLHLLSEYLSRCSLPQYVSVSPTTRLNENTAELEVELDARIQGRACPRLSLIKWFLNSTRDHNYSHDMSTLRQVTVILVSLIVKRSHILIQVEYPNWLEDGFRVIKRFSIFHDDYEVALVRSCFEADPVGNSENTFTAMTKTNIEDRGTFSVINNIADFLLESLEENYDKLTQNAGQTGDFMDKFIRLQARTAIILNVINLVEKYNLTNSELLRFRTSMDKLFDRVFSSYVKTAIEFMRSPERNVDHIFLLLQTMRRMLTSGHLCDKVKKTLASKYPQQLQVLLKKIVRTSLPYFIEKNKRDAADCIMPFHPDSNNKDSFKSFRAPMLEMDDEILTETRMVELASLEALRFLADYGLICDHRSDLFLELLSDLTTEIEKANSFQLSNQFHFDLCAEALNRAFRVITPGDGLLNVVILVIQLMCRGFYSNLDCAKRLWELFKELTPLVARETEDENKKKFMTLVGTLAGYLKNAGIKSSKSAFSMLSTLAKFDPYLTWSSYTRKADDNNSWILLGLQEYLSNPSHQFRNFAADTICYLFSCEGQNEDYSLSTTPGNLEQMKVSTEKLKEFYLKVYESLRAVYDVPIGLQPDEIKEESVNRTSLVLSCLARILFQFPLNQKKALFCLFLIIKLKTVSVSLTSRALRSYHLTAPKTMICHVSYILRKWIKMEYSLNDFPYLLFDCDNITQFFIKFKREISVQYFENNNFDALHKFATDLNLELGDLIQDCYGTIMGRLAPGLAALAKDKVTTPTKHLGIVKQSYQRLIQLLGGKNQSDALIVACLGDVTLNVVSLLNDPTLSEKLGCPWFRLPEPEPPTHDEEGIQLGLNFLQEICSCKEVSIIGYLVQTSPRSIFNVLITLIIRVHEAHDRLEKVWRLHHFSYFVKLLMNEPQNVFELMRVYMSQFVVHAYLRLLRSEEEKVVQASIHFLTDFVEKLMACSYEELIVHYRIIVNGLISVVLKYPKLSNFVTIPLNFLLKTYGVMFADCIVTLDPFPTDLEFFQEYYSIQSKQKYGTRKNEWGLMKELKNCLDEVKSANGICSKERLKFVREMLSTRKAELETMVKELEGRKFWDECSIDIIHNLIQMLVRVIVNSPDPEEVLEASRCLGEIGPIDLAVLVLPPYGKKAKLTTMITAISSIIEYVAAYLLSDDIQLVLLTGSVLESVLEVTECVEFLRKDISTLNPRLDSILTPFKSDKPTVKSPVRIIEPLLQSKLGLNDINEFIDYQTWIIQLTCGLIDCIKPEKSLACRLLPLCKLKVDFCEYVLSFVMFVVLYGGRGNPLIRKHVSNYFRTFFNNFSAHHQNNSQASRCVTPSYGDGEQQHGSIYLNKLALRSLIRVIQFLRHHLIPQEFKGNIPLTPWDNNFWLDVNYLDLAKAAQYCGAYLTSILYAEIYSFECLDDQTKQITEDDCNFYSQETTCYPKNRSHAVEIEKLLLKAYTSIGESDAVYSCGSARFSDFQSNIQHLQQMQQWGRSLTSFDSVITERSSEVCNPHVGICRSLKELGLCSTLWTYMEGIQGDRNVILPELSEIQYECGWRLSKWDLNCNKATYLQGSYSVNGVNGSTTIQKYVYESIWFGLANDRLSHNESIRRGITSIVSDLKHASLQSSVNLYDFMSQFQMLRIIEDFFKESESLLLPQLVTKWKLQDRFGFSDFKYQEPILHLRSVLLHSYGIKQKHIQNFDFDSAYDDCLLELLTKARDSKRLEFAENCTTKICSISNEARKELEIAKNYWARGDQDIARLILGRVIKKRPAEGCDVYPSLLLLFGMWLSETKADRPSVILEKYLQRSCQLYEMRKHSVSLQEVAKAHIVLAKYADAQYQTVTNYMKSELFIEKVNQFERAREELKQNQGDTTKDNDMKKSEAILRKQSSIDHEEIQALMIEKKKFLLLALRHYLRGLSYSNDHDLLIFRAFALWLENSDQKEDLFSSASKIVAEEKLSSYKYLMVLHQLSARMGVSNNSTVVIINNILIKCAKEHPFHTLPVLLTQSLLHKDKELIRTNAKKHVEDRVKAATRLIDMLKKDKENNLGILVQTMEKLWLSLIYLANVQETKNIENLRKPIPPNAPLRNLKNLEDVLVPTLSIPISTTLAYKDNIVGITSFDMTYSMVGGINSPKRISCLGTNGVKYNMLLKGQDDLRQDAVMQQVFGVMNKLLQAEPSTKARRLQIRTYKVVPLSQRSGIIEWCENTQTFGDYLVGSGTDQGAHCLYRPMDYKPGECRKKMNEVKDCRDNVKKRTVFLNILEHFKPVFRHFFFENFKDPGTYFERRLAYTRSVATSSMVGYILGLGDRHVLNILVDKNTAEFIHIDLGVAFEQGRILPTPETIPFRLTRDVVDGMGVSGVEGVFRRSCEMTLDVLRTNSEIILTILEVLLYDPLYIWTVTADRVQKVQPGGIDESTSTKKSFSLITGDNTDDAPKERNNSAARVLLRLKQKLMGIEEGGSSGSSLSVKGHVSLLIQCALDTDRYSKLFPGWQPYL